MQVFRKRFIHLKLTNKRNILATHGCGAGEGGNQPNLNLSKVKEFEIPFPSLADQTEIVHRVETLFALADRIETRCTAARTQAAILPAD